jgi:hypothetical protein
MGNGYDKMPGEGDICMGFPPYVFRGNNFRLIWKRKGKYFLISLRILCEKGSHAPSK